VTTQPRQSASNSGVGQGANQLRALRNILGMEADNGYQDKAVAGGLDRFLETLQKSPDGHPAIRSLANHGLLGVGYGGLDLALRKRWAQEAGRIVGDEAATSRVPAVLARKAKASPAVDLQSPIDRLASVNKPNAAKLAEVGVATVRDLLFLFPNRHNDFSALRPIAQVVPGEEQTIVVGLWEVRETRIGHGGRMRASEAVVGDESGNLRVIWFNQPWVATNLKRAIAAAAAAGGDKLRISLSGKVSLFNGRKQMDSPEWEVVEGPEAELVNTGRLVPVYPQPDKIYQKTMRRMVREALEVTGLGPRSQESKGSQDTSNLEDQLPSALCNRLGLMPLARAVALQHYPDTASDLEASRRRLAFDELLTLQLAIAARRDRPLDVASGIPLPPMSAPVQAFLSSLPFKLTGGQDEAIKQAMADVSSGAPMSRLLQGDVGSGKTVVAVAMLLTAVAGGYQGLLMAPTEVLAEQHFLNIRKMMSDLEGRPSALGGSETHNWFSVKLQGHAQAINIALLTGSTKAAARREIGQRITNGSIDILIGTHALIQKDVKVPNLALAVADEQHRFGVLQRAALRSKGHDPHLLLMSATPIPRTLALTLYGDLDVSTMPELPMGRKTINTRIVPPSRGEDAEAFLVQQVEEGRQCFVVCPLIDESEAVLARAATAEYERLRETSLAGVHVDLLHGRMPLAEKQVVMEKFRSGKTDVLVTTPVIEVGIDVPNATVMLIEGADRFGLAQLHQLRGRVGRGEHQSYCFLLSEALSEDTEKRLNVLVQTNDGFDIAEADLRLRGPGDFFGTRQSGLPTLRMATLDDRDLLLTAKDEAKALLEADPGLKQLPELAAAVTRYTSAVSDGVA
jgi:ATP-dependent DNA helicase RecG